MLKKAYKWFVCKLMRWHGPVEYEYFDGASFHAKCKYCGYEGMIDSGGNLF